MPENIPTSSPALADGRGPLKFLWLGLACGLLTLAQVAWAGYQLGFGNQGIQIPFLEALHNPALFSNDQMVATTLQSYPSYFFHICAKLLAFCSLPTLYLVLHFLATAGVFAAIAYVSRALTRDRWVGFVAFLLLAAGHHHALAGETLYSQGFTHTWATFPLSLCAVGLFYRGRYIEAFALAGAIFNLHALEAAHLAAVMGFAALCRVRKIGLSKLAIAVALFIGAALPTLWMMARQHQTFDTDWLQLMRIRSADHSFPTAWWEAGSPDVPRFLCLVGLAALALGYPLRPTATRKTLLLAAGVGLLFVAGTVFTEFYPLPVVVRAQLFRSSRLLLMIAFIVIAHGCVAAWRLPWRPARADSRVGRLARWQVGLEVASATLTAFAVALPPLLPLLPIALSVALLVALINGRLAWYQALAAGAAVVVCLLAWETIQFVIPGLTKVQSWSALVGGSSIAAGGVGKWLALLAAAAFWWLYTGRFGLRGGGPGRGTVAVLAAGAPLAVAAAALLVPPLAGLRVPADPWADAQRWARDHTPADALFLTPPQQAGFRTYSQRAVVGEMRDGTQLYFKADFARPWWDRMAALQPGILRDPDGKSLLAPGKPLDRLDDAEIVTLAQRFGAQYVVLPHNDARGLEKIYDNDTWAVFRPQIAVVSAAVRSSELGAEDTFLRQTALPNIEKYRKGDGQILIVDAAGRPVDGLQLRLTQTGSAFQFGVTPGFFAQPKHDIGADYKPPAVTPAEKDRALGAFNALATPFAAQWRFVEPAKGKPDYADLDALLTWCADHGFRAAVDLSPAASPAWAKGGGAAEAAKQFQSYAAGLAKRFAGRPVDWEIAADRGGNPQSTAAVIAEVRKAAPHARVGLLVDGRFWSPPTPPASPAGGPAATGPGKDLSGLADLQTLKAAGTRLDFVALQARRPVGLWASGPDVYRLLDAAGDGLPVHVTEFGVPVGARIEGAVRDGRWTPDLRAEYYERFLTLCFSHPAVEAVNVIGLGAGTWLDGQGLLDESGAPTPAYDALHRLITQKWRTQAAGITGLNGHFDFRGYYGTYQLTLGGSAARQATTTLAFTRDGPHEFRFRFDPATGALTPAGGGQ
jgi:hypothetical protein